ncbi:hypothetical protein [Streptomyces virginiae]|uniref:hypothetical protein n=1 Tax=Streptomyces virginiae TaxID=1961 RepID=UPI0022574792|nr:hypothetical protein [Streptomyces virginiae]MCX4960972.1 hypothetical protein [Streptomyces virginiae]
MKSVHSFRYLAAGDYWFNDETAEDQDGPTAAPTPERRRPETGDPETGTSELRVDGISRFADLAHGNTPLRHYREPAGRDHGLGSGGAGFDGRKPHAWSL